MIVIFKPTLRCNLKCSHCFVGDQRDAYNDMTEKDALILLSKIPKGAEVVFHGGEPTLLPTNFYRNLVHRYEDTLTFTMQTNLSTIDGDWCDFITGDLKGKISTSFDINSSLRPIHTKTWMDNIEQLKAAGTRPYVVSMLCQQNQTSATHIYHFFNDQNLSFRINPLERLGYAAFSFTKLRHQRPFYAESVKTIFDLWFMSPSARIIADPCGEILSFLLVGTSDKKCPFTSKCSMHFISINPNGDAYPCGGFEDEGGFRYGNLLEQPLSELMSSPVQIQASQRALCLPQKCHSCNYLSICGGGCRLEAYSFYGDIYRETSLCPEYQDIFTHIEKRIEREKGDVTDWWFSLCDSRAVAA